MCPSNSRVGGKVVFCGLLSEGLIDLGLKTYKSRCVRVGLLIRQLKAAVRVTVPSSAAAEGSRTSWGRGILYEG